MKRLITRTAIQNWRRQIPTNRSIGFVPTMGALHEGHLALIQRSLRENNLTLVSIFVNPTQFGPKEDFKKYPRPLHKDLHALRRVGVQAVFTPTPNDIYPSGYSSKIEVPDLSNTLCGSPTSRGPRHFSGVATVVAILFGLTRPSRAYFGLKDFQQVRVIEQMVSDLNLPVKIMRCPIIREKNGLAKSSRNEYLTLAERTQAPKLYSALQYGRKLLRSGAKLSPSVVRRKIIQNIEKNIPIGKIDYVELVDPKTLKKIQSSHRPTLIAAALKMPSARLIDNILVH